MIAAAEEEGKRKNGAREKISRRPGGKINIMII